METKQRLKRHCMVSCLESLVASSLCFSYRWAIIGLTEQYLHEKIDR